MTSLTRPAGCLESLVHYKLLLAEREPDERANVVEDCLAKLDKLKLVDPMRRWRYDDLGAYLHANDSEATHARVTGLQIRPHTR